MTLKELNSGKIHDFLKSKKPDLILSYGCHLLSEETLSFAQEAWNIHGGISPWYRGTATHFWPSYMLEPQATGMTVHETTPKIDGGPIVHQSLAKLVRDDGIHDLSCRAVQSIAEEISKLLEVKASGKIKKAIPQKTSGKLWLAKEWQPEHLRLVYETYNNKIVNEYLDGRLNQQKPELIRQF